MQSCAHSTGPFVSLNREAAALQLSRSCFDIKGSMTVSHGDQGEKSRALKGRANSLFVEYPQPEIWKERRFLGDMPKLTAGDPG